MAMTRPVTVKGPDGEFKASRLQWERLYQSRSGFSLVADEDGKPSGKSKPSPSTTPNKED